MYTRSYYPDGRLALPENYDGTAFSEAPTQLSTDDSKTAFSENTEEKTRQTSISPGNSELVGSTSVPFLSGLFNKGGLFGALNLRMPTIGTEEILIIAMAAFLLFSKGGDKESAIILLLLLFIG